MKKIRRKNNVTDEKVSECFARHLPYEIDMLRELYLELLSGKYSQLLHNSHIESFLIHARNLIEFFKNKEPCDFDPRLFTDESYEPNRQFINSKLLDKINEQIAHLTADRTAVASEQLGPTHWAQIKEALESEISRFEKTLKPEHNPTWKCTKRVSVIAAATQTTTSAPSKIFTTAPVTHNAVNVTKSSVKIIDGAD